MLASSRIAIIWLILTALTLTLHFFPSPFNALIKYPADWVWPITEYLNIGMGWFVSAFGPVFKLLSAILEWPVKAAQQFLGFVPWSVTTFAFVAVAWRASGWRLALFTLLAMIYMAGIGYWAESMNSLALVLISVPLAIMIGFGIGVLGFYSARAQRIIMPTLDLLQTIPAFAYLLPILILFGFGTTVGLVSSILYAFPPMVRNTILGLRSVNASIVEAGEISGGNPYQIFWKVRFPAAKSQMLLGANQTTMAALSMVIIASIIGGTNDIGWEVLKTMRKAQFGESLLAGFVIALLAMLLDRITYGFATQRREQRDAPKGLLSARILLIAAAVLWALSFVVPMLAAWPASLVIDPAPYMNSTLERIVIEWRITLDTIKNSAFFFLMLPIKIGLSQAISPFSWGFEFTPFLKSAYAVCALVFASVLWRSGKQTAAIATLFIACLLFIGMTNMPWLILLAGLVLLAYQVNGLRLAIGTLLGLLFLVISDVWPQAVLSLYLCGVSVLVAVVLGVLIGICAAHSTIISTIVRPLIDTLQTMPLFVILIPFVMVFKIGEFTALLAIVAYAIVPAIRYTEHGLRNLPTGIIESATALGTTPLQLLVKVKLPLALPAIMLGLNQTIMYGISMLVITALVGTTGLGQRIYIGLGDGDFGVGMTAGIGMAIMAMIADRMTQAISAKKQKKFGLKTELM